MPGKAAILGGEPVFEKPIPFARPTLPDYSEMEPGLRQIFSSGMVTKGRFLSSFEEKLSETLEVPYAIGVANCTLGLLALIRALGLTGEVIVPSFSFMATFNVVEEAGLKPVFVDCEKDTFTIDPAKVEAAITPRTSAIFAVCIFGNPPDMNALERIAKKHDLKFITDSAHSFGTLYHGRPMGRHGDGEAFSTSATKLLATGEGGVVTTPRKEVADFIKVYREYGNLGDYDCEYPGLNCRMSEFHALLGLKLLPRIEEMAEARNGIARAYREALNTIPGIGFQKVRDGCRSSFKDFVITIDEIQFTLNRNEVAEALKAEGVATRKYFSPPGHRMKLYKKYLSHYPEGLKNTEYLSDRTLNLPIYSHMDRETVMKVIIALERIFKARKEIAALFKEEQAV